MGIVYELKSRKQRKQRNQGLDAEPVCFVVRDKWIDGLGYDITLALRPNAGWSWSAKRTICKTDNETESGVVPVLVAELKEEPIVTYDSREDAFEAAVLLIRRHVRGLCSRP